MFLLIAAPVYERDWILPYYFEAIERQDFSLSQIGFVFITAPGDDATHQELFHFSERHPELRCFDVKVDHEVQHKSHPEDRRSWNSSKYANMVKMRNDLLDMAVCLNPDLYFSLDSDILLEDPTTISQLIELAQRKDIDAVSPLMYMHSRMTFFVSVMSFKPRTNYDVYRTTDYPIGSLFQVDVIMAAVMMSPKVFQGARYQLHSKGEDCGWAADCHKKGFKLWSASYIYCPHIMTKSFFEEYKKTGDPRDPSKRV